MKKSIPILLATALFHAGGSMQANLLPNGDFEGDPFTTGWSVSTGILEHPGLIPGSSKAALLTPAAGHELVHNLPPSLGYVIPPASAGPEFAPTGPVWSVGFYFASALPPLATDRSLNVFIGHDVPAAGNTNSPQINFRLTGDGAASVFQTGAGWQPVFPAGTVVFSDFDNNSFSGPTVYYLLFEGDYSLSPYYRVAIRKSTDGEYALSAQMAAWQYANPVAGDGLIRLRFTGTGTHAPYAVDGVSLVPESSAWTLAAGLAALILLGCRRRFFRQP